MSNYTKTTNFTAKDSLSSGDTNKVVRGSEIDTELTNIQTAIGTKADTASPTFTGSVNGLTAPDNTFFVVGSGDVTKKIRFEVDGNTAGTTRVLTAPDYDSRISNLPAGIIMDYAGSSVPTGWLECDGTGKSTTTYAALFAAIGYTWGGSGATFNVPDFRGRSRIGKGTGVTVETVTASSGNGFTVASNNDKWVTGMPVVLSALSGFTTSASAGPTYYVSWVSSTNIRLATTLALAQAGTPDVTISGSGSCIITRTMTARTLAEIGGDEDATELLTHTHIQPAHSHALQHLDGTGTTYTASLQRTGGGATSGGGIVGSGWTGGTMVPQVTLTTTATNNNAGTSVTPSNMQPFGAVMTIISI